MLCQPGILCSVPFLVTSLFLIDVSPLASAYNPDCTQIYVHDKNGLLLSPNFPLPYYAKTCLTWLFHKNDGELATLSFYDLDLPKEDDTGACYSNYIEIRSASMHRRICGEDAPPLIIPQEVTEFTLRFISGSAPSGKGFRISFLIGPPWSEFCGDGEFHCGDGKCILESWRCNRHSECADGSDERNCREGSYQDVAETTQETSPAPAHYVYPHKNCQSVLRNRTGSIGIYVPSGEAGPRTRCWLIQPEGSVDRIILRFKKMNFEPDAGAFAYVVVYKGSQAEYDHSLGMFPQRDGVHFVTTRSSSMLVVFHMDAANSDRDLQFSAEYSAIGTELTTTPKPTSCFYWYKTSQGNFTMPPPPYNVRDIQNCEWRIHKPFTYNDPVIHLIFTTLFLQDGATVVVYDGPDSSAAVLGSFNSSHHFSKPISLWSTWRDLLVRFRAPPHGFKHHPLWIQFTATYHFEEGCANFKEMHCGAEDDRCYSSVQRCDGVWDCPKSGFDELGCHGCTPSYYSCNDFRQEGHFTKCYAKHERCNGETVCANAADEMNCDETCSKERKLFLCANKQCILELFVCDGASDCADGSDEIGCGEVHGTRYITAWAVGGSLLGSLILVLAVGIACKVFALRHNQVHPHTHSHHHRSSRYDTPLSRLQAEMFRRRAPPPPYHEAMLTSRPYDEAVREYLAQQAESEQQENRGSEQNGSAAEAADSHPDNSVHNLINLMDFEDAEEHRQPLGGNQARLEIRVTEDASSDSDSEDAEDGDDFAEDGSGHIEMSENLGRARRAGGSGSQRNEDGETESILLENVSQDSHTLSADSNDSGSLVEEEEEEGEEEEEQQQDSDKEEQEGGDGGEESDKDSDADSVCILCLDNDGDPAADDDGTDTRCLLQDV